VISRPAVDYVLPLRWADDAELGDLTAYLRVLSRTCRVIVVDGSPPELYAGHAHTWAGVVTHVPPDRLGWANGKVDGATTGLRLATAERVVIADDDVRYGPAELDRLVAALDQADLVGPQNVFAPLPWHARWDTGRTLLNRALGADYPGTFAIRRSTWVSMGGYDGDVLFENLELMRTVRAWGGTVRRPRDLYVARRPPTTGRFWSQRVRQAYDDLAQPARLVAELAVAPAVLLAVARRRGGLVLAGAAATVGLAEAGRRRDGGRAVFPASTSWWAPLWLAERAVCVWVALGARLRRGGVPYGGGRLRIAAHSPRTLRRRQRLRRADGSGGRARVGDPLLAADAGAGAEARDLVRPVAERLAGGTPAPAQGHRAPPGIDLDPVGVEDAEVAADEQRPVDVRRDRHPGLVGRRRLHAAPDAPAARAQTLGPGPAR
jgi:hypothetical protein